MILHHFRLAGEDTMNEVTVLGLGSMGSTIAKLFIEQGRQVTVWNRSPQRADTLVQLGATLAENAEAAVRASRLLVMCVYDYAAADSILQTPGVASSMADRVLVQLTTGSPADARAMLLWATRHGADYLDGAIQAAPSQMGQPDTPVLLSGNEAIYRGVETLLKDLAGNVVYLGERIEAAATMDLATLSYVYGATAGFLHGARLAESQGLDVAQYGRIVNQISPSFGAFFQHEGAVIESGDFAITESPMRISIEATQRILRSSRDAGLNIEIPGLIASLFERADTAGLGDQELAALIKVLREDQEPSEMHHTRQSRASIN
jgi:3-hydroxyisobutyrate dehydrogenase-like beta-hydroxyacid dehydrogenase